MIKNNLLRPINLSGDLRRGGWLLEGELEGDTDAVSYGQNWQLRAKSGAGNSLDPEYRSIFDGHILSDPNEFEFNRLSSTIKIVAGTMNEFLEGEAVQAIGFSNNASPANDHQINGLDIASMVEHILRDHCNVVYNATTMPDGVVTSVNADTTNSTTMDRFNVDKSDNIWRTFQDLGGGDTGGEFYSVWFTRNNEFYYQPTPAFFVAPPTSKGTITKDHLIGTVKVKINNSLPRERIGQVELTAFGDYDTFYNAVYPTNPGRGKILPAKSGVWAQSQARANTLALQLYGWLTRTYTLQIEVDAGLVLFGDDGKGLDLGDKVTFTYDGPLEDTKSGAGVHLDIDSDFFVYGADISFDVAGKAASAILLLEQDPS